MSQRSKVFFLIGIIIFGILVILRMLYPYPSSSTVASSQDLSTATAPIIISSATKEALLSTTTPTSTPPKKIPVPPVTIAPLPVVPPPVIAPVIPISTSSPSTSTITDSDPAQIAIDPQTIVGILCYYNDTYTNGSTGQNVYVPDDEEVRGSGTIINSNGNILTNRHIVEQPDSETTIDNSDGTPITITVSYQLDHCEVGQLPKGSTLPTAAQIESINPYIQLPVLGYTAQPVFISKTSGLSPTEIQYADFAILKITGVSSSGPTFGITSVPSSFPHATLLPITYEPDVLNAQVITYGFPGDVTTGQGNFFETLTMTGSVGTVTSVDHGDAFYANTPLLINTDLEIAHGRSGSPLFWRGYVIGMVTFFVGDNDTHSGSVASDAILKGLQGTNYIPVN